MINPIPTSALVDDALKAKLQPVLDKLERNVELRLVLGGDPAKSAELHDFVAVIASLSPHLSVRECSPASAGFATNFLPAVGLFGTGGYSGVAFHGVPGGKEINSLMLALYNFSGSGQPVDRELVHKIRALRTKTDILICVSLHCSYCSDTVAACQHIALLNPAITAAMVDAKLYPDLVAKYSISSIPLIIMNGEPVSVGGKTIEDVYSLLQKRD